MVWLDGFCRGELGTEHRGASCWISVVLDVCEMVCRRLDGEACSGEESVDDGRGAVFAVIVAVLSAIE